jgi:outer membrane immunogenic protein
MITTELESSIWSVGMRKLLLAAMMFGAATAAHAADLSDLPILRGSYTDGLTTSRANWQGYYIGGQASYGSATSKVPGSLNSDMQTTFVRPPNADYNWQPLGMAHSISGGFGAFAGYNSQWDDVVVSVEANYIHDGIRSRTNAVGLRYLADNVTLESLTNSDAVVKLSDFGSLRLRGGYAIGCFLPYAFAGLGFGGQTIDRSVSAFPAPVHPAWTTDSKTKLVYGYSAGVGVDMMLVGGVFARAEYEYRRVTSEIETNVNTVRAGLGYKF